MVARVEGPMGAPLNRQKLQHGDHSSARGRLSVVARALRATAPARRTRTTHGERFLAPTTQSSRHLPPLTAAAMGAGASSSASSSSTAEPAPLDPPLITSKIRRAGSLGELKVVVLRNQQSFNHIHLSASFVQLSRLVTGRATEPSRQVPDPALTSFDLLNMSPFPFSSMASVDDDSVEVSPVDRRRSSRMDMAPQTGTSDAITTNGSSSSGSPSRPSSSTEPAMGEAARTAILAGQSDGPSWDAPPPLLSTDARHILQLLLNMVPAQLYNMDVQGVVNTTYSLALLRHNNQALLESLLSAIEFRLDVCTPQNLSNLIVGIVYLRHTPDRSWMRQYYTALEAKFELFGPRDVAMTLWAFGRLQHQGGQYKLPSGVVNLMLQMSYKHMDLYAHSEVAICLWGLARLGFAPGPAWSNQFFSSTFFRLSRFRAADLSLLGWSLGQLGLTPEPFWMVAYFRACHKLLRQFTSSQMCQLMSGIEALGLPPPDEWSDATLVVMEAQLTGMPPRDLVNCLLGTVNSGVLKLDTPYGAQWMQQWLRAVSVHLDSSSTTSTGTSTSTSTGISRRSSQGSSSISSSTSTSTGSSRVSNGSSSDDQRWHATQEQHVGEHERGTSAADHASTNIMHTSSGTTCSTSTSINPDSHPNYREGRTPGSEDASRLFKGNSSSSSRNRVDEGAGATGLPNQELGAKTSLETSSGVSPAVHDSQASVSGLTPASNASLASSSALEQAPVGSEPHSGRTSTTRILPSSEPPLSASRPSPHAAGHAGGSSSVVDTGGRAGASTPEHVNGSPVINGHSSTPEDSDAAVGRRMDPASTAGFRATATPDQALPPGYLTRLKEYNQGGQKLTKVHRSRLARGVGSKVDVARAGAGRQQLSSSSNGLNAIDLCMALHSLAHLRVRPDDVWMLRLFACMKDNMEDICSQPNLVAMVAWSLDQLRVRPPSEWIETLLLCSGRRMQRGYQQQLVMLLSVVASWGLGEGETVQWWMPRFWWRSLVLLKRQEIKPASMCLMLSALRKMGAKPHKTWMRVCHKAIHSDMMTNSYTPRQLATVMRSLASLGNPLPSFLRRSVLAASYSCRQEMLPGDWGRVLWALMRLQVPVPAEWTTAVLEATQPHLLASPGQRYLTTLLVASVKLDGQPGEAWMSAWFKASKSQFGAMDSHTLCTTISYLAQLDNRVLPHVAPAQPWLAAYLEASRARLGQMSDEDLVRMIWGLNVVRATPPVDWIHALVASAKARTFADMNVELRMVKGIVALRDRLAEQQTERGQGAQAAAEETSGGTEANAPALVSVNVV